MLEAAARTDPASSPSSARERPHRPRHQLRPRCRHRRVRRPARPRRPAAPRRPAPRRRRHRPPPHRRLSLHRRGQDRRHRPPLRPAVQGRLEPGDGHHAQLHPPPHRHPPRSSWRRPAACAPSSTAPRTSTSSCAAGNATRRPPTSCTSPSSAITGAPTPRARPPAATRRATSSTPPAGHRRGRRPPRAARRARSCRPSPKTTPFACTSCAGIPPCCASIPSPSSSPPRTAPTCFAPASTPSPAPRRVNPCGWSWWTTAPPIPPRSPARRPARPGRPAREVLRAPASPEGFNYSRLVNLGTARATTPLVLHLNNDVEALEPGWLEDMVGWSSIPGVGVVGAKLLYPDGTLNHAGISLSRTDGLPHVLFEREPAEDLGTSSCRMPPATWPAVTGACLLTRTDLYRQLGGFDEDAAPGRLQRCRLLPARRHRRVTAPCSPLRRCSAMSAAPRAATPMPSASMSPTSPATAPPRSLPQRRARLPAAPSAAQSLPPALRRRPPRPFRALVLTHNLNFEGAPIFIFELARYLAEQPGVTVTVASPQDGPLRARFEEAGLKVEIWEVAALATAKSPADSPPPSKRSPAPALGSRRCLRLQHHADLLGGAPRRPARQALRALHPREQRREAFLRPDAAPAMHARSRRPSASPPASSSPPAPPATIHEDAERQRQLPHPAPAGLISPHRAFRRRPRPRRPPPQARPRPRRRPRRQHRLGLRAQGPAHLHPRHRPLRKELPPLSRPENPVGDGRRARGPLHGNPPRRTSS
jgi:hypothetical protein